MDRSKASVTDRFLAADSPADWVIDEIGEFLDGDSDRVDELLANLDDRSEALNASIIDDNDIIAVEVNVTAADGTTHTIAFRTLPHPVEVLWTLAAYAEIGDTVTVAHHRLDSVDVAQLRWPFDLDDAIVITSPDLVGSAVDASYRDVTGHTGARRRRLTTVALAGALAAAAGTLVAWRHSGRR
jgi:CBS-domain-containing membrane protein